MSSNIEAFVKTFSRRNRSTANQASTASLPPMTGVNVGTGSQIMRVDQAQVVTPTPMMEAASDVPVRHSEVRPASADPNAADHVGQQQRVVSLQHTHTAYASTTIDPAQVTLAKTAAPNVVQPFGLPAHTQQPPAKERFDFGTAGPPSPHQHRPNSSSPHQTTQHPSAAAPGKIRKVEPFQAVWEVDVFDVPACVADLFFDGKRYQQIGERMSDAVKSGLQSVLITSSQSGEGRSSVAIGIAMAAAASGIRVALVDADTQSPTLADDLRLELQYGWVDTIRGGLPIKEIAVHAVEDGVTLIPLMTPIGQTAATAFEVKQLIEALKNKFDLLVVDGPSSESSALIQIATTVDSAVLVRDVTKTDVSTISELSSQLLDAGIQGVGVVDNFV